MVDFLNLRISPDGLTLDIQVKVSSLSYYENTEITGIYIDTQDTYVDTGQPSSKAIEFPLLTGHKEYTFSLTKADLNNLSLKDNLFFIYVKNNGLVASDTPCGMDKEYTLGVVMYPCNYYNNIMQYVKQVENECVIPKNFIHEYLKFKALQSCIETRHYTQAIIYYNKYFKKLSNTTDNTCGCHG
jgi:hypothetical protein